MGRPGIQAALTNLEVGKAELLIIASLSRFSRDREHQSAIQKRVIAAGASLVFCDMPFEDTPEGDLALGMMGRYLRQYPPPYLPDSSPGPAKS